MGIADAIGRFIDKVNPPRPRPSGVQVKHSPGNEPEPTASGRVAMQVNPIYHNMDLNLPQSSAGPSYLHLDVTQYGEAKARRMLTRLAAKYQCQFRLWHGEDHDQDQIMASIRGPNAKALRRIFKNMPESHYMHASDDVSSTVPDYHPPKPNKTTRNTSKLYQDIV
jgi:hypothetical protein